MPQQPHLALLDMKHHGEHPAKETHFGLLYLRSYPFSQYSKPMTLLEFWIINGLVNSGWAPVDLALHEHNSKMLELLHLRKQFTLKQLFQQSAMIVDLEVLTLILTASHSATDQPRVCWRSLPGKATRTTSWAKSRNTILRSPTWTRYPPGLHLEILS